MVSFGVHLDLKILVFDMQQQATLKAMHEIFISFRNREEDEKEEILQFLSNKMFGGRCRQRRNDPD